MENKKGFTLIELLAVIVILAIILAIAIPSISGIVKNSTKSSMGSDAKLVLKSIDLKKLSDKDFNPIDYNSNLAGLLSALKLSGDNYESIAIVEHEGKYFVTVTGKNKWAGLTACGNYHNMSVIEGECELDFVPPVITLNGDNPMEADLNNAYVESGATVSDNSGESIEVVITGSVNTSTVGEYTITYTATDSSGNITTTTRTVNVVIPNYAGPSYKSSKGVNGPLLTQGMTPIKRSGDTWVDTDIYDPDWYEYGTTTETRKWANVRTNDCTTPGNIETCSMWVWIPRYAYQITSGYHTATAGTIDVKFLKGTTNTTSDSTQIYEDSATDTHFVKHPAFDFGGTPITGMWVAKFEHSNSTSALDSKPGVVSLRYTTLGDMFIASRNMETNDKYGWALASGLNTDGTFTTDNNNLDTHMMKSSEWGAVAYLAQSTYGKNAEITTNGSSGYYTGGGGGTSYATFIGQSTTGTIYGIYDMSGGSYEYIMGNYNNTPGSSGLTPSDIDAKYIDRYTAYDDTKYGDAVYETSSSGAGGVYSWYADYASMMNSSSPWFLRDGGYGNGTYAGTFYYCGSGGSAAESISWFSVVSVGTGL